MEENKTINQQPQEDFAEKMKEAQKTGIVSMKSKQKKKDKSQNYTHKFSEPVEIQGKKFSELTFYFDKLRGTDIEAIEEELQDENK